MSFISLGKICYTHNLKSDCIMLNKQLECRFCWDKITEVATNFLFNVGGVTDTTNNRLVKCNSGQSLKKHAEFSLAQATLYQKYQTSYNLQVAYELQH